MAGNRTFNKSLLCFWLSPYIFIQPSENALQHEHVMSFDKTQQVTLFSTTTITFAGEAGKKVII